MASPTIESLCCLTSNNAFSKDFLVDFQTIPYNVVSIVASGFGIAGAIYQILPRAPSNGPTPRSSRFFKTRGRVIIRWLALADLLASLGILLRSASWLADDTFGSKPDDSVVGQYLCIVPSAIIHYFYTATYCWTFLYALDVKQVMYDKRINHRVYHLIAWLIPLILCCVGLLILYLPDLNCHSNSVNPYIRFLPNYMSTFLPIVVVMIGNPVLYCIAFSKVERQIMSARGRFTQSERRVVDGLRKKFFLINLVFYICWLPNIINGIVLWTSWEDLPRDFILTVWYLMAILNPLQAVFNCIVYRSWDTGTAIARPRWSLRFWTKKSYAPVESQTTDFADDSADDQIEEDTAPSQEGSSSATASRGPVIRMSHERTPLLPSPGKDSFDESTQEIVTPTHKRYDK